MSRDKPVDEETLAGQDAAPVPMFLAPPDLSWESVERVLRPEPALDEAREAAETSERQPRQRRDRRNSPASGSAILCALNGQAPARFSKRAEAAPLGAFERDRGEALDHLTGRRGLAVAFAVAVAAATFSIASGWGDVLTVDEVAHLGAGYSYLVKRDMRMNPEHPPLIKDLAAVPLLFLKLNEQALSGRQWEKGYESQCEAGRRLIYRSGNDTVAITRWAHLAVIPVFVVVAVVLFSWTRRLYGGSAALLALVLFAFSPTVLAHAKLVTTDVGAAMGALISIRAFLSYLKRPSPARYLLAGLLLGVALLIKFSLLMLLPVFLLASLLWSVVTAPNARDVLRACCWASARTLGVVLIGFVCVVWPAYCHHTWDYAPERQRADVLERLDMGRFSRVIQSSFAGPPLVWAADKPLVRGLVEYVIGAAMVQTTIEKIHPVFWLGKVRARCGPLYFPLIYFMKEPAAWWVLVALALVGLVWTALARLSAPRSWGAARAWIAAHFDEVVAVGWIALYWATALKSSLTIGVRHLLPVYPFMVLLVAGILARTGQRLAARGARPARAFTGAVAILVGLSLVEVLAVYPHMFAFFNRFVGGPTQGYRFVADSNLDWGQDLARLCRWAETHGVDTIELDYFGWADAAPYCGDRIAFANTAHYDDLAGFLRRNHAQGWLAVSATHRHFRYAGAGGHPHYEWLDGFTPAAVIGHSIFVYHVTPTER